jgi:hypothetical protein
LFTTALICKRSWTLAKLRLLPQESQITRHICIEGWSAIGQWSGVPFRVFLEDEEGEFGTHFLDLLLERGGDVAGCFIGDDGDAFVRLEAQAIADGVARAGSQLRINGKSGGEKTVRHLRSAHHGAKNRRGQSRFQPRWWSTCPPRSRGVKVQFTPIN